MKTVFKKRHVIDSQLCQVGISKHMVILNQILTANVTILFINQKKKKVTKVFSTIMFIVWGMVFILFLFKLNN